MARGYRYWYADFVAEGDLALLRFVVTPTLKKKGLVKVEAWDWDVADIGEGEYWPRKKENYGMADKRALLTLAMAALSAAGEPELATEIEGVRGQVEHRVYYNE